MEDMKDIQWFPGHMAKTRRMIQKSLPLVDAVAELLDARLPLSSRNPEFDRLTRRKPRLVILNKADMADTAVGRILSKARCSRYYRRFQIGKGREKLCTGIAPFACTPACQI